MPHHATIKWPWGQTHAHTHMQTPTHTHTHTHTHTQAYRLPGQRLFHETRCVPTFAQHVPGLKLTSAHLLG